MLPGPGDPSVDAPEQNLLDFDSGFAGTAADVLREPLPPAPFQDLLSPSVSLALDPACTAGYQRCFEAQRRGWALSPDQCAFAYYYRCFSDTSATVPEMASAPPLAPEQAHLQLFFSPEALATQSELRDLVVDAMASLPEV